MCVCVRVCVWTRSATPVVGGRGTLHHLTCLSADLSANKDQLTPFRTLIQIPRFRKLRFCALAAKLFVFHRKSVEMTNKKFEHSVSTVFDLEIDTHMLDWISSRKVTTKITVEQMTVHLLVPSVVE